VAPVSGVLLDIGLGLVLLGYAWTGLRQGFVVSVLSLAGFLGGGALAMLALPTVLDRWRALEDNDALRAVVVVGSVFVCAALGQGIAVALGRRLRPRRGRSAIGRLDAVGGMAAVLAATGVLVWVVAGSLRPSAPPAVASAMSESRVLAAIDAIVPERTSRLFARFQEALDAEGFPRVFEGFGREPITAVGPPDGSLAASPAIEAVSGSIVKVIGTSTRCDQGQEGSGWVAAPGRVVTNAHVVAGLEQIVVRVRGVGTGHAARVVLFDPQRDLAVLDVPGLDAAPLERGPALAPDASAVVAGFPLNGPYNLQAARVRRTIEARGADIYGQGGTSREVYSLRAVIRQGNSGGPLLDPEGRVVGIVFAKSIDDQETGYALTLAEAEPVLRYATASSEPVSTGACVSY
jgi:S1-C subfamily serine protease